MAFFAIMTYQEVEMKTLILEIRAGEGGEDSKLFMVDMIKMYASYASRIGASMECL